MTIHDVVGLLGQVVSLALLVLIGFIAWLFRSEIRGVLSRIRRGKFPGVEVELDSVESLVSRLHVPTGQPTLGTLSLPARPPDVANNPHEPENTAFIDRLLQLASAEPALALIRLRVEIEQAVLDLGSVLGDSTGISLTEGYHPIVSQAIEEALAEHAIPADIVKRLVTQVSSLANRVQDYLSIHTKAVSLPASDPRRRGAMFAYLDLGVRLLNYVDEYADFVTFILETVPQSEENSLPE